MKLDLTKHDVSKDYTVESLKKNINHLKSEGYEVKRLKEREKRRRSSAQMKSNDERIAEDSTKDLVETIVKRFLEEKNKSREENTLKIEVVENPHSGKENYDRRSKYVMIAKFRVGQKAEEPKDEVLVKASRLYKRKAGQKRKGHLHCGTHPAQEQRF